MSKVCHWVDFVRFVHDQDFWSRWKFQLGSNGEQYFIEHWAAARDKRTMPNFDFSKTEITLMSKDESNINWEHDGESIYYFFLKWMEGRRV